MLELCVLQCDGLKVELQELQVMYDSSQRERAELEEELQRCKAELEKLSGGAQVSDGHQHLNTPRRTRVIHKHAAASPLNLQWLKHNRAHVCLQRPSVPAVYTPEIPIIHK